MNDREEFDRIVEHLELDLSGLDEPDADQPDPTPAPTHPAGRARTSDHARSPDVDEQFYRRIDPPPPRGWKPGVAAAWAAVVGSPLSLVVLSLLGFTAPRILVVALSLVFIGSAVYLIAQLPEHGPSRGDDPDDGAVL